MNYAYIYKELRHRHHRTMVNILGIAVGIALFVSINAVSTAYEEAVSRPFKNIGADLIIQRAEKQTMQMKRKPISMQGVRLPFSNQLLPIEDIERLKAVEDVEEVAPALLLWEFSERGFKTIMGVDLEHSNLGVMKVGEWITSGRFPTRPGEIAVEAHYARFQKIKLGSTTTIGNVPFTVVGLVEIKEGAQIATYNVYVSLQDAQKLLPMESNKPNAANIIYLRLHDPSMLQQVKSNISSEFKGISVSSSDAFLELMGGISQVSYRFAAIVSVVALVGAVLLITKTMLSSLVERSVEIGILKTVGWSRRDILKQLLGEALLQSIIGGLIGIILGYVVCYFMSKLSISMPIPWTLNPVPAMSKDPEAVINSIQLPVRISSALAGLSLAISVLIGGLACYFLAFKMAAIKPADVLRKL